MDPASRQSSTWERIEGRWVAAGTLVILFAIFVAQNSREVRVDFVFFNAEVRLIWVFLICGVMGAIIDRLLLRKGVLGRRSRRRG